MSFWSLWRRSPVKSIKDPEDELAALWTDLTQDNSIGHLKSPGLIENIVRVLETEEKNGSQRACFDYALSHNVFEYIARLSRTSESLLSSAVDLFARVIPDSADDIMNNDQVVRAVSIVLLELHRIATSEDMEEKLAKMLFDLAARLRLEPECTLKWIEVSASVLDVDRDAETMSPVEEEEANQTLQSRHGSLPIRPIDESRTNGTVDDEDMPELIYELPAESKTDAESNPADTSGDSSKPSVEEPEESKPASVDPYPEVLTTASQTFFAAAESVVDMAATLPPESVETNRELADNTGAFMGVAQASTTHRDETFEENDTDIPEATEGHSAERIVSHTESIDLEHTKQFEDSAKAIDSLLNDLHTDARDDFPLFRYTLDLVHREGRAGEFARTGLIYIVESAIPESDLERWILNSDFGMLIASGLGALYSQLNRSVPRTFQSTREPKIVSMAKESGRKFVPVSIGEALPGQVDPEEEAANNGHLRMFLSYLAFWQDILGHCKSHAIRDLLLENFDALFLKQLLLPSLAESTDISGSVAIAVMVYLRAMFESLNEPNIVDLLFKSLMVDNKRETSTSTKHAVTAAAIIDDFGSDGDEPERRTTKPTFSLVDLISDSLESASQETNGAALQLVSTLLRKHYPYTLNSLFHVTELSEKFAPVVTPYNVYAKEVDFFLSLVPEEQGSHELQSQRYEAYLHESRLVLETHPFAPEDRISRLIFASDGGYTRETHQCQPKLYSHVLKKDDHVWNGLLRLFAQFFANSVELNLVLTRVFMDLASCGWMSLRGWMLLDLADVVVTNYDERKRRSEEEGDADGIASDSDESGIEIPFQLLDRYIADMSDSDSDYDEFWGTTVEEQHEQTTIARLSPMMEIFELLNSKIDEYKQKIPGFNIKLAERRELLQEDDDLIVRIDNTGEDDYDDDGAQEDADTQTIATTLRPGDDSHAEKIYSLSPIVATRRAEHLFAASLAAVQRRMPFIGGSVQPSGTQEMRAGVLTHAAIEEQQRRQEHQKQQSMATVSSSAASVMRAPLISGAASIRSGARSMYAPSMYNAAPSLYRVTSQTSSIMPGRMNAPGVVRNSGHGRTPSIYSSIGTIAPQSTVQQQQRSRRTLPPPLRMVKSNDSLHAFESLLAAQTSSNDAATVATATTTVAATAAAMTATSTNTSTSASTSLFSTPRLSSAMPLQQQQQHGIYGVGGALYATAPLQPMLSAEDIRRFVDSDTSSSDEESADDPDNENRKKQTRNKKKRDDNSESDGVAEDELEEAATAIGTEAGATTAEDGGRRNTKRRGGGIEMDDIVPDEIAYTPAVIQVTPVSPDHTVAPAPSSRHQPAPLPTTTTTRSRYVSVAHLLGNVIVYEEFAKEMAALVQVRSTLFDSVDYGWQRSLRRRHHHRPVQQQQQQRMRTPRYGHV
ncbi:Retinoic acid induced 16-like protein-domain-containing protein [Limtongia smithiae]|uniref:Retinoic acid induced 16-like protein-domain-containing protein n=1 Tax=Limtongia smithiae TaxID=1125753 RepID=UPI0034CDE315